MDSRRTIQLASLIVITNAVIALLSPPRAVADQCFSQGFCDDVPCNPAGDDYKTLCRIVLGVTCPCKVCEGFCTNVGTCAQGETRGWITCVIGDPEHPCP
jgi:hypothetical protein